MSQPSVTSFRLPSADRGQPVFRVRELTKIYGDGEAEVRALGGVDLECHEGEFLVVLGASGSGKSTLLNLLGGLDTPTSGELYYRDWNLGKADDDGLTRYRREAVGFVFQFYNLIPSLTALENVALITEIAENPMTPEEALEMVGLAERMNHFPSELSGGEQQRVAIARAIAKQPEVLMCDEPTGALDVNTGVAVMEAIERINRELGTLTLVITHNAVLSDIADRVLTLSGGHITGEQRNQQRAAVRNLSW